MRGAWLSRVVAGLVLLFGGASACLAQGTYDRQLESAIKRIVAGKIGDIRGPLEREWTPPETSPGSSTEPAEATDQPAEPLSTGSFVTIDPPAIALQAATTAASLVTAAQAALEPLFGPPPVRQVRVIPLYH